MRVRVKQAEFWTKQSTRLANRLEALLLRYYPAALECFQVGRRLLSVIL